MLFFFLFLLRFLIVLSLALLPATGPENGNATNLTVTSTTPKSQTFSAYITGDRGKNVPVGSDVFLTCHPLWGVPLYAFTWNINGKHVEENTATIRVKSHTPSILSVDCGVTDSAGGFAGSDLYIQTFSGERETVQFVFFLEVVGSDLGYGINEALSLFQISFSREITKSF